jgi:hypothetical protein
MASCRCVLLTLLPIQLLLLLLFGFSKYGGPTKPACLT